MKKEIKLRLVFQAAFEVGGRTKPVPPSCVFLFGVVSRDFQTINALQPICRLFHPKRKHGYGFAISSCATQYIRLAGNSKLISGTKTHKSIYE